MQINIITKTCRTCHRVLNISEFHKHKTTKDRLRPDCRECRSKIQKQERNSSVRKTEILSADKYKLERRERATTRARKNFRDFLEYKRQFKCSRCPENDPACLEFHHIDPSKKVGAVSSIAAGYGIKHEKFLAEINKCIILCANCHRKEHYYSN